MCGQKTGFKQNDHAGQSPSPLLVVFSCFFVTRSGFSLLDEVTLPEDEDELELVADAPQQEDDDSWLTLVLGICWDAHECPPSRILSHVFPKKGNRDPSQSLLSNMAGPGASDDDGTVLILLRLSWW